MRAFVRLRETMSLQKDLVTKLADLEGALSKRSAGSLRRIGVFSCWGVVEQQPLLAEEAADEGWHPTLTDPRTFRGVVFNESKGSRLVFGQDSSYMDYVICLDSVRSG